MTTKVIIEVPTSANYLVETVSGSRATVYPAVYLKAGERTEIYLHDDSQIFSIREVVIR
jgi:hypothetical protein